MELIPIKVKCHAGYSADEYPINFTWENIVFDIFEIIDRWYDGYIQGQSEEANYFKVKTNLAGFYMLRHETENDKWFLVI